jgi:hypothetical protein
MTKMILVGAILTFGLASLASAGTMPVQRSNGDSLVTPAAEGCGPGRWRGPRGGCHPFAVGRLCPPGYHIGRYGRRCWPN